MGCFTVFLVLLFLGVAMDGWDEFIYLAMKHSLITKVVIAGIVVLFILGKAGAIQQASGNTLTPEEILKRFRPSDVLWILVYTFDILLIIALIGGFILGAGN